jgi:Interferon-induced transmembrane protein
LYCTRCGALNVASGPPRGEGDLVGFRTDGLCQRCGAPLADLSPVVIHTYLVPAFLVSFLLCLPLGLPAVLYALRAETKVTAGDLEGAREAARSARTWCWIAAAAGLGAILLSVVAAFLPEGR